ncbi:MlaD family protein [Gordonia malaquae]|uniref:MlaD family protein n=1 Tax=Gordonia malaquae TaxID=410332 RepID=UPI0030FE814C
MKDPFANINLTRGSDLRWGIIGMALAGVGLLAAAVLYFIPLGKTDYTAEFRYSGSLSSGDEVRIAGINVGTVGSVTLDGDVVRVGFTVDDDQRLGILTEAEVKLLTPVGGHYLSVTPRGSGSLDGSPIPKERTKTPFELTNVLESMAPVAGELSGNALRETIREVNRAIGGEPDAIRRLMSQGTDLLSSVALQSDQLTRGMRVTDEYVGAIAADKELLAGFVRHLGGVAVKLADRRVDVITTFQSLKRLAKVVHRPIMEWGDRIEPAVDQVEEILQSLLSDVTKIDDAISGLRDVMRTLGNMLGERGVEIDQSESVVTNTGLCVPLPGSPC